MVIDSKDLYSSALYNQVMENFERFATVIEDCMDGIVAARSFSDPNYSQLEKPLGSQVIVSLASVFYE